MLPKLVYLDGFDANGDEALGDGLDDYEDEDDGQDHSENTDEENEEDEEESSELGLSYLQSSTAMQVRQCWMNIVTNQKAWSYCCRPSQCIFERITWDQIKAYTVRYFKDEDETDDFAPDEEGEDEIEDEDEEEEDEVAEDGNVQRLKRKHEGDNESEGEGTDERNAKKQRDE